MAMVLGRSISTLLVVLAVTGLMAGVCSAGFARTLYIGSRQYGDRLVWTGNVLKSSSIFGSTQTKKEFRVDNGFVITQVVAIDQKANGAIASRLRGGPGFSDVALKFKSKRGSINFRVEIYAKPRYLRRYY